MAIVFSSKLAYVPEENLYSGSNLYTGYALFWGGLIVGMCNFICGIAVGINGSSAALADAADPTLYAPFSSFLSRFKPPTRRVLITSILDSSKFSSLKSSAPSSASLASSLACLCPERRMNSPKLHRLDSHVLGLVQLGLAGPMLKAFLYCICLLLLIPSS